MKIPEKPIVVVLGIFTALNVIILFVRNGIEANSDYNFLLWNLFLGFVPFGIAYILLLFSKNKRYFIFYTLSAAWLLFYPNAPYMITDLIHVQAKSTTVIYDTLIIFGISTLSIFYGFFSLKIIYTIWSFYFSHKVAAGIIVLSLFLSSLGIYLGRIIRLNSWDLFTHPLQVFESVIDHLWPINQNPDTYYIVFLFTFLQGMMLLMIHYLHFNKNITY